MGAITGLMGNRFDLLLTSNHRSLISSLILVPFVISFCLVHDTFAAEWTLVPLVAVLETYDDNIRLAGDGQEEEDYITQINPGFSLVGKGRYSELMLDYTMQNIFYKNNDKYDDAYHNLRALNSTEVYRNHLYFDASVNYSQRTINLQQTSSTDNLAITDNRTDVVFYTAKPYFIYNFGQSTKLLLEHSYAKIDSKQDGLSNTDNTTNASYIEIGRASCRERVCLYV